MERLKRIWKSIKRFFYLWYLRIRYYKKVFTISTSYQSYGTLEILNVNSANSKVIVLYKSRLQFDDYYVTKVILWKD